MSAPELKLSIRQLLDHTDDPEVLVLVYSLLKKLAPLNEEGIAGYEADGTPITDEELVESVLASSRETKAGHILTTAEIKALLGIHV